MSESNGPGSRGKVAQRVGNMSHDNANYSPVVKNKWNVIRYSIFECADRRNTFIRSCNFGIAAIREEGGTRHEEEGKDPE